MSNLSVRRKDSKWQLLVNGRWTDFAGAASEANPPEFTTSAADPDNFVVEITEGCSADASPRVTLTVLIEASSSSSNFTFASGDWLTRDGRLVRLTGVCGTDTAASSSTYIKVKKSG